MARIWLFHKKSSIARGLTQIHFQITHSPSKRLIRTHALIVADLPSPTSPEEMDWTTHFPNFVQKSSSGDSKVTKQVEIADIGCGFGGLIVALSPMFPEILMLGMELRTQVTDYVINRIAALRSQNVVTADNAPGLYQNISALRSNTMKFLPNYFKQSQLSKIFLCFPDPHFKQRKHKARIVSAQLNAEYAFVVRPGGRLYTITDVEELHQWMVSHFEGEEAGNMAGLWARVSDTDLDTDPCVKVMGQETEESKKVARNGGKKFIAVWTRKGNPAWPE